MAPQCAQKVGMAIKVVSNECGLRAAALPPSLDASDDRHFEFT